MEDQQNKQKPQNPSPRVLPQPTEEERLEKGRRFQKRFDQAVAAKKIVPHLSKEKLALLESQAKTGPSVPSASTSSAKSPASPGRTAAEKTALHDAMCHEQRDWVHEGHAKLAPGNEILPIPRLQPQLAPQMQGTADASTDLACQCGQRFRVQLAGEPKRDWYCPACGRLLKSGLMATGHLVRQFVEGIARLELAEDGSAVDEIEVLGNLIAAARKLTGVRP